MTLAGLALLTYPPAVREELRSTLLDAGASSRRRMGRELASLVTVGLRTRAQRAGPRRVLADGLCLAAAWQMTLDLSILLAQRHRGMHDPLLAWPSIALLGVALALVLVGYDRAGGVAALAWTAARTPALLDEHTALALLGATAVPVACLGVLVLAPRRRTPDPRRLAWLIVPAWLVATLGPPAYEQSPLLRLVVIVAMVVVVVAALAALPFDPRLAIAGTTGLSTLGLGVAGQPMNVTIGLFIAAAPCIVAVGMSRLQSQS